MKQFEITNEDRAELGKRISDGFTSGIIDTERTRLRFEITIDKWCTICGGTGEIMIDLPDGDGHYQTGVGTKPCECRRLDDV